MSVVYQWKEVTNITCSHRFQNRKQDAEALCSTEEWPDKESDENSFNNREDAITWLELKKENPDFKWMENKAFVLTETFFL